jgi:hypothetical protein
LVRCAEVFGMAALCDCRELALVAGMTRRFVGLIATDCVLVRSRPPRNKIHEDYMFVRQMSGGVTSVIEWF